MKKRISTSLALLSTLCVAGTSFAGIEPGRFSLTPFVGGIVYDGVQQLKHRAQYGVRLGYDYTKNWGAEASFGIANTAQSRGAELNVQTYNYKVEGLYNFMPNSNLVPFLAAGVGGLTIDNPPGIRSRTSVTADWGGGLKYFLTDAIALRGDARHIVAMEHFRNHYEYALGLSFFFGGAAPAPVVPPPAPAPAPVVEKKIVPPPAPAAPLDSDGDGVIDDLDRCPGTPAGVKVDKNGCPVDTDGDGVPDYLDKCPGTPKGVSVDKDGCPLDSDGDGVPDYLDKCPNSPKGVSVDKNGCPLDSDGDGVFDYMDKCPNTPANVKVDKDGCPMTEKLCVTLKVEFDTNKADIKPKFHNEIAKAGDFLKKYPDATGVIEGHTDNKGSKELNDKLSQKRAESVRQYLIDKFGIEASRLSAKGYGFSKPVADNATAEGRAKNRRIDAVIDCVITLKKK